MKTRVLGLALLMTVACGKDKDEKTAEEAPTATAALNNASSLILAINDALASVPSESFKLATNGTDNPLCSEHGKPLKDGNTKKKGEPIEEDDYLSQTDKNYPSHFFSCLATLTAKEGASVETIQGNLAQTASVFCNFEKTIGSFEYTAAGTNLLPNGNKEMTLDKECWPNGTPEGITSITIDKATATALDESTGFEKELYFHAADVGDYRMRFFNRNGIVGFRKIEEGNAPAIGGYADLVLDSNKGVVLMDVVDDRGGNGGADSVYTRTQRVRVSGDMDKTTLKFKSLNLLQGIQAQPSSLTDGLKQFSGVTINGTKDAGFYGTTVSYSDGTFYPAYEGCTGAKADCTATGLKFTDGTFAYSRTEWAAHRTSGMPICENGKDLTFAAVPANGKFGSCE